MSELSSADPLVRALASAPAIRMPLVGDQIGRFELRERLGAGGMGVVFGAFDLVLRREVAIKVLAVPGAAARELVLREARLAATVTHRGVAAIYDVVDGHDHVCLVLERVYGETLRALIERRVPIAQTVAVGLVLEVLDAVAAAHEAGVLHRDLKPENIMRSHTSGVKLLDFGLGSAMDRVSGAAGGTWRYQAPEAREGLSSAKSDLYSVGLILEELLFGALRSPSARPGRWVASPLERVIAALVAPDPEDRPIDARAARAVLERAVSQQRWGRVLQRGAVALLGVASLSGPQGTPSRVPPGERAQVAVAPAAPIARIACAPLETEDPADGWLGAAASNLACRQARARLGGSPDAIVVAGELAQLEVEPREGAPYEPWSDPARLEAAAQRGEELAGTGAVDGILAGSASVDGATFTVRLELRQGTQVRARGEGSGSLAEAVRTASVAVFSPLEDALVARRDDIDGFGAEELEALTFAETAAVTGGATSAARRVLQPLVPRSARAAYLDARLAATEGSAVWHAVPPVDRTSDVALAISASLHALAGGDEPALRLAEELARTREDSPEAIELLQAEGLLRFLGGERQEAGSLGLAAALAQPATAPWGLLDLVHYGRPEWKTLSRVRRAWTPEVADAWNISAHVDADDAQKGELLRRAALLGEGFPLFTANYGVWLVRAGRLEEARIVMARLGAGQAGQRVAAARIGIDLALAEGRIRVAHETALRVLDTLPSVGSIETGDVAILAHAVELGALLGDAEASAGRVVERFVLSEPPRLDHGAFARTALAHVCAYASRPMAARCFSRLASLDHDHYFPIGDTGDADLYVLGAEAFSRGDWRQAAGFFRRSGAELGIRASVAGLAFERVGDFARADKVDPPRPGPLSGLSLAHVRAMRRALSRDDCARVLELAQPLAAALRSSDVETRAHREVEGALTRCCKTARCKT
jgi:hypothetical protein